jgi:long-chain acyl-CoA synthetase
MNKKFNITKMLEESTSRYSDREAVRYNSDSLAYQELYELGCRFSRHLQEHGLKRNDAVVMVLENSLEYIVCLMGVFLSGAVAVPLNPGTNQDNFDHVLYSTKARLVIIRNRAAERLNPQSKNVPAIVFSDTFQANKKKCFNDPAVNLPGHDICEDNMAMILFTSGTTGPSKGVMLSHANILANTRSIIQYLGLTEKDSIVNILPFFYSYGNSILMTHLAVGGRVVIENRFIFPKFVLETMQRERPSGFSGVPSTFYVLLSISRFLEMDWHFLRYVTQAGGGMRQEAIERLRSVLPETKIFIMYGQTEASARLSYLPPDLLGKGPGAIGKGIPGVELKVVNKKGEEVRIGEVGEIKAWGDNIMLGYLGDEEGTQQVLKNGWLYTGDLAKIDDEGFIYFVGRKKNIIKTGGYRISHREIEEIIVGFTGVKDVAVIGIEDEILGEAIGACVSMRPEAFDEEAIRLHCQKLLPLYKVPKHIFLENEIPRTGSGKIKYRELRNKYANKRREKK